LSHYQPKRSGREKETGDSDGGSSVRREAVIQGIISACDKRHSRRRGESLEAVRRIFEALEVEVRRGAINGSPFPIHGKMGPWTFEYYGEAGFWVATADEGKGLPEERARVLFGETRQAQPHGVYGAHGVVGSLLSQKRTVDLYYIYTMEALKAFIAAIRG
jgi:hypothetical protein